MNKILLSILAGATMLSSVASASPALKIDATDLVLPTGDQVISDLYNQNVGGINNVSLSKYEQAWMIVHDKESIFKHKTFWVRTGKVFTGIAIDDIKDLSKSERSEFIIDSIKKSVLEAALKDQAEMLANLYKEEINKLQAKFTQERVNAVAKVQADLDAINNALDAIDTANTKVKVVYDAGHEAGVASVDKEHNVRVIGGQLTKDGYIGVNINKDITADDIINVGEKIKEAYSAGVNITQDSIRDELVATFGLTFTNSNGELIPTNLVGLPATIDALEAKLATTVLGPLDVQAVRDIINSAKASATIDNDRTLVTVNIVPITDDYKILSVTRPGGAPATTLIDDTAIGATGKKSISIQHGNSRYEPTTAEGLQITGNDANITTTSGITYSEQIRDEYGVVVGTESFDGYTATVNITTAEGTKEIEIGNFEGLDVGSLNAFVDTIAELSYDAGYDAGFEAGYDAGFSDGYESGYADGYTDGFNDGVASVTAD